MCAGIKLKDGDYLQSIGEVEAYFKVDLAPYRYNNNGGVIQHCCLCLIDLDIFMDEEPRKGQFEYDYIDYWEI